MLKIGDFSKLARISIRMLRHYDDIGLLTPACTDRFTGYRYYSEDQLPLAGWINALKDMGFGLAAIREILNVCDNLEEFSAYLKLKRIELQEQAEEANRRLLFLETALKRIGKDGTEMNYNVTLKELPARTVASVRQIIPAYDQEAILWNILMKETASLNLQPGSPCYTLALFHDGEHKEKDVDVEI